jgi:hypothetical protein
MTCSRSVFFVLRQIEQIVAIDRLSRNLPAVIFDIKRSEIGLVVEFNHRADASSVREAAAGP